MFDRSPNHPLGPDPGLRHALRALPLVAPPAGAWENLAATMQARAASPLPMKRRSPYRWAYILPTALAAGLVLFFMAPNLTSNPPALGTRTAETTKLTQPQSKPDAAQELAALHAQSQSLEQWLRDTRNAASSLNGQDLMASAEIEDLIGFVDVQLQAPAPDDAAPLWRQRVRLLQDLAALRYSQYSLAETRVANDGTSATHALWTN